MSLTRRAFDAAYRLRRPKRLIFHSDRGIEYAAPAYRNRLRSLGVRQSMTSGGAPSENLSGPPVEAHSKCQFSVVEFQE